MKTSLHRHWKGLYAVVCCLLSALHTQAQLVATTASPYNSPSYLVNQVFRGHGIQVSNVSYSGNINQFGFFTISPMAITIPMDSGLAISTGNVNSIDNYVGNTSSDQIQIGTNYPTDVDMSQLMNSPTQTNQGLLNLGANSINDLAKLEFDFVPDGDSVALDFIFASEEYGVLYCGNLDNFGIFVSGPNINGPFSNNAKNIAVIDNTNPPQYASIYNINNTNLNCAWAYNHSNLYVSNQGETNLVYQGHTKMLSAHFSTLCGVTYHLKICVAEALDKTFDSGILLKAGSLRSLHRQTKHAGNSDNLNPSLLVENCNNGSLTLTKTIPVDSTQTFYIHINDASTGVAASSNLALEGIDFANMPDTVILAAGQTSLTLPINVISDTLTELNEHLFFGISESCNPTYVDTFSMSIVGNSNLAFNLTDAVVCSGDSISITPNILFAPEPFHYLWSTGDTTSSIRITPTQDSTFVSLTITSPCSNLTLTKSCWITRLNYPSISLSLDADTNVFYDRCQDTVTIKISLSHPATSNLSYTWGYNTTANINQDFILFAPFQSILNFAPGDSVKYYRFRVKDDLFQENTTKYLYFYFGNQTATGCSNSGNSIYVYLKDYVDPQLYVNNAGNVCKESSMTVNLIGNNLDKFSYQWMNNSSDSSSATYVLDGSNTLYNVIVTDTVCHLPVNSTYTFEFSYGDTISVIAQPHDSYFAVGDTAVMSCLAIGNVLLVQWQKLVNGSWIDLTDNTKYSHTNEFDLRIANASLLDNNSKYRCIIGSYTCSEFTDEATLSTFPTGIKPNQGNTAISIFPNPTSETLHIKAQHTLKDVLVSLSNVAGETLLEKKFEILSHVEVSLNLLPTGVYVLHMQYTESSSNGTIETTSKKQLLLKN